MEIAHACQISVQDLIGQDFDLLILANKLNERSSFLLKHYILKVKRILVLVAEDDGIDNKKLNPELPPSHGVDILELSFNNGDKLVDYIDNLANRARSEEVSILLDYSCMSKFWYAAVIKYLYLKEILCERINVFFVYIPIEFREPKKSAFKQDLHAILKDPVSIPASLSKKALIVGLGYDIEKAEFLIQKVKPAETYFFYSDPAFDVRYTKRVLELNERLILRSSPGNLFSYPMQDMDKIVEILTRIVLDLRLNYQVILASFGPKLLTLACLLLFARFPDIEILSAGQENHISSDDIPINTPVVYKAVFLSDEKCE